MSDNEIFFICVVIGGFGLFALSLAAGTLHDRRWAANAQRNRPAKR